MGDSSKPETSQTVKAVENTCRVLSAIQKLDEPGVTDIANHVGISKGAIHRHLVTLTNEGYVTREDTKYQLSVRFFSFGNAVRQKLEIYQASVDELDKLAEESEELSHLMVEFDGIGVVVYQAAGKQAVRAGIRPGEPLPLCNTAAGKALLSELSSERVNEILDQDEGTERIDDSFTGRERLHEELEQIREDGISTNEWSVMNGIRAIGVPITDSNDELRGAISISGPSTRMSDERFEEELPNMLLRTKNLIEINMAHF